MDVEEDLKKGTIELVCVITDGTSTIPIQIRYVK
jgi:hypothetical protein